MVTRRALWLLALVALGAGCLSAPPSGVISCENNCPISGYYCAGDGYCWANGEYPNLSSSTSGSGSTSAGTDTSGTGGTASSGVGTGGSNTTGGSSTGRASTGGSSTGAKASTGSTTSR
jgi:hypothetical protein